MTLSKNKEDYLETIFKLIEDKGVAKTKDIAKEMKVKPPSVSEMLIKLKKQGLVKYKKYSPITLTQQGEESAKKVLYGHNALKMLLQYLDIPEEIAEEDACTMEHHLHPRTVIQINNFVNFLKSFQKTPDWLVAFKEFCKKSKK